MNIVEREIKRLNDEFVTNARALEANRDLLERYQVFADEHGLEVIVNALGGSVQCTLIGHFFEGGADKLIAAYPAKWCYTWDSGRHIYDVTIGNHVYRIAEDIK